MERGGGDRDRGGGAAAVRAVHPAALERRPRRVLHADAVRPLRRLLVAHVVERRVAERRAASLRLAELLRPPAGARLQARPSRRRGYRRLTLAWLTRGRRLAGDTAWGIRRRRRRFSVDPVVRRTRCNM